MMTNTFKTQNSLFIFLRIFSFTILAFLGSFYLSCQSGVQNSATQTQKINRDWSTYPAILELDSDNEIFVIGDIHGNYEGLLEILLASEIISETPKKPERVKWKAGNAILVVPGDFVSKGPKSVEVLLLLQKLQKSALKSGGRVILTFGNHEAEFLANPKEEKVEMFKKELKKLGISPQEVANGEDKQGIGKFLQNLPFAARVNDWYFVHAGHPKKYTFKELEVAIIKNVEDLGFGSSIFLDEKNGMLGKRWDRKENNSNNLEDELEKAVDQLGVNHIVIGHEPGDIQFSKGKNRKKGKIFEKFNGMIFFVDTGMWEDIENIAYLHIKKTNGIETATAICLKCKKKMKSLWEAN